jgi:hypothetical protein
MGPYTADWNRIHFRRPGPAPGVTDPQFEWYQGPRPDDDIADVLQYYLRNCLAVAYDHAGVHFKEKKIRSCNLLPDRQLVPDHRVDSFP